MLGSNSKENYSNCFPVCFHSNEKWDCFQGGKKETSMRPRESAYMQALLASCYPQWGMWSGHENSDCPTYSAQELFLVHPSLRKAWKWRKYLEGKRSLDVFGFFPAIKKFFYSFVWLDKSKGIKIFLFSVLPPFPFSKSACHYLNFEIGFSSSW